MGIQKKGLGVLCLLLTLLPVSTLAAEEGTGESDPAINQDGSDLRKDPAEEGGKQEAVESGTADEPDGPSAPNEPGTSGDPEENEPTEVPGDPPQGPDPTAPTEPAGELDPIEPAEDPGTVVEEPVMRTALAQQTLHMPPWQRRRKQPRMVRRFMSCQMWK